MEGIKEDNVGNKMLQVPIESVKCVFMVFVYMYKPRIFNIKLNMNVHLYKYVHIIICVCRQWDGVRVKDWESQIKELLSQSRYILQDN